jgi:hypothetical protein
VPRISNTTQRRRTKDNPLDLGTFGQTSLRYLTGTLGPVNQVELNGYGGGTMNHWFRINIATPAWIITRKGAPRPNYIQLSAYDLNFNPIQGRMIFDQDSIQTTNGQGEVYYPYVGHMMGAASDFYNNFDPRRVDKGNDLYYPLQPGSYLLCVSSTRNERLDYSLGLVIEVADLNPFLILEDFSYLLLEDSTGDNEFVLCDLSESYTGSEEHEHSLAEWKAAWSREHQDTDAFPDIFVPLVTRP